MYIFFSSIVYAVPTEYAMFDLKPYSGVFSFHLYLSPLSVSPISIIYPSLSLSLCHYPTVIATLPAIDPSCGGAGGHCPCHHTVVNRQRTPPPLDITVATRTVVCDCHQIIRTRTYANCVLRMPSSMKLLPSHIFYECRAARRLYTDGERHTMFKYLILTGQKTISVPKFLKSN